MPVMIVLLIAFQQCYISCSMRRKTFRQECCRAGAPDEISRILAKFIKQATRQSCGRQQANKRSRKHSNFA